MDVMAIYLVIGLVFAFLIALQIDAKTEQEKNFERMMFNITWIAWIIVVPLWLKYGEELFKNLLNKSLRCLRALFFINLAYAFLLSLLYNSTNIFEK